MIKTAHINLPDNVPSWVEPCRLHNKTAFASIKATVSSGAFRRSPWMELVSREGYINKETFRTTSRETMVTLNEQQMIELRDMINEALADKVN